MLPYVELLGKQIPMYGVCLMTGILIAGVFAYLESKKRGVIPENLIIIAATAIGLGMVGAKGMYIIVSYSPAELIGIIKEKNFSLLLQGGFVFYGGLIFGILGAVLGCKMASVQIGDYENIVVKYIPLAHAFGRIGCFCAGCCYGAPADGGWGVVYSNPLSNAPTGMELLPVQLYEAFFNVVVFIVLWSIDKRNPENKVMLPMYLGIYAVERFILEFLRFDKERGFLWGISTSQLISIVLFIMAIVLFVIRFRKNKKQCQSRSKDVFY